VTKIDEIRSSGITRNFITKKHHNERVPYAKFNFDDVIALLIIKNIIITIILLSIYEGKRAQSTNNNNIYYMQVSDVMKYYDFICFKLLLLLLYC